MKVKELIERLKNFNQDDYVVISAKAPKGKLHLGGSSCVQIKDLINGFDWDAGKVFLYPDKIVRIIDDENENIVNETTKDNTSEL